MIRSYGYFGIHLNILYMILQTLPDEDIITSSTSKSNVWRNDRMVSRYGLFYHVFSMIAFLEICVADLVAMYGTQIIK